MNRLIDKLNNILTAMAYAEAGDFDAVKRVLQEESKKLKLEERTVNVSSRQPAIPAM